MIDSPARYTVTEAATKTGKTASHIVWLLEQALTALPNQSVWWVAPVFSQAEIAFNRMRNQISVKGFFRVNESKLRLTTPNGAHIQFKSAEKPDNLYGDDVYAAVFDEFTRSREEAWFALRSTLTKTKGKCKFIGNVKGKKNWGYRLALKAKSGEDNMAYFRITAYDAVKEGLLTEAEIEQAKRDLPETVFKELYLAEPNDDGSNPFGIDHIKRCLKGFSTQPTFAWGIDLAKSTDWTVVFGVDSMGMVTTIERFQKDWESTKNEILKITVNHNTPILIDSTGVGDPIVEQLQRMRPNIEGFKFTSASKQQIMEGLAVAIQQGKTSVITGTHRDELEAFEYEYTRTGVRYSAPEGVHDDIVCAHALAIHKLYSKPLGSFGVRIV